MDPPRERFHCAQEHHLEASWQQRENHRDQAEDRDEGNHWGDEDIRSHRDKRYLSRHQRNDWYRRKVSSNCYSQRSNHNVRPPGNCKGAVKQWVERDNPGSSRDGQRKTEMHRQVWVDKNQDDHRQTQRVNGLDSCRRHHRHNTDQSGHGRTQHARIRTNQRGKERQCYRRGNEAPPQSKAYKRCDDDRKRCHNRYVRAGHRRQMAQPRINVCLLLSLGLILRISKYHSRDEASRSIPNICLHRLSKCRTDMVRKRGKTARRSNSVHFAVYCHRPDPRKRGLPYLARYRYACA